MNRRLLLGALSLLVGCSAPAPTDPASPRPLPSGGNRRAEAAAAAGVDVDQVVDVGGIFVAPRLDEEILQLVEIAPAEDTAWETTVLAEVPSLATLDDVAPDRTEYFVTCSTELGLTDQRFIIGEATAYSEMRLEGLSSVGGQVVAGTYLLAVTGAPGPGKWELLGDGAPISSGSTTVFPQVPPDSACRTH